MQDGTFSSAQSRERDKRIEEKHRKELSALERKIDNVRRTSDELRKELFDVKNRTARIARCLGYPDVLELQEALDVMPPDFNLRTAADQVGSLETEVSEARSMAESYVLQLEETQDRLKESQAKNDALTRKNDELRAQNAAQEDRYIRAAERYKLDYKKWRNFNEFLQGEVRKHTLLRNSEDTTVDEKQYLDAIHSRVKLILLNEKGPDLGRFDAVDDDLPPPIGGTEFREDLSTPHPMQSNAPFASSSRTLVARKPPYSLPSSSPTLFTGKPALAASSDTEEDPSQPLPPVFKLPAVPREARSSDTEESSPPRPVVSIGSREVIEISSDDPRPNEDDEEQSPVLTPSANANRRPEIMSERPLKMRRLNEDDFNADTPRRHNENVKPLKREPLTDPKPSTTTDYSVFKGKGRYSRKSDAGPSTSVNAQFVIDPKMNGGLDYQYDEVVRGRNERKKMKAGTCQECDEYYDAVGPLPSRLQAPLWRSPSKTPQKKKQIQCTRHHSHADDTPVASSSRRREDIESHKKDISRHRYTWDRPKTPPSYWSIGFPSTQEVQEINAKAEEMHQQKVMELEKEAASGTGKYRRR